MNPSPLTFRSDTLLGRDGKKRYQTKESKNNTLTVKLKPAAVDYVSTLYE